MHLSDLECFQRNDSVIFYEKEKALMPKGLTLV